ncbi:Detected protein of confused Function [Hibiscus syriacus]|uniref:Detected protein of confused Function n=1 Tax=Hibiscus syriacus TaxID=106335 RepID=A0A6A2YHX2_HIBSY|nr:uncharacterized protein LOC120164286 [Hibiscus syriacus]KAE8677559.1 Detected protein of confused Function [Hibiscus syriacus]
MRFFRRIAGLLGIARDDGQEVKDQENDPRNNNNNNQTPGNRRVFQDIGLPRRGFSVPVQVAATRPNPGPVLLPCNSCDGGVQGLKWYAKRLRMDEDGDVADEFLDEVSPETSASTDAENEQKPFPKFQMNYSARAANVKTQVMSHDGKMQQCVEHQGRLQWI